MIESAWALSGRGQTDLSEQQLLDCWDTASNNCNGGPATAASIHAISTGYITEAARPYTAVDHLACNTNTAQVVVRFLNNSYTTLPRDENVMLQYLSTYGPFVVCYNVVNSFYSYTSGVYSATDCGSSGTINHAVLVIGYGVENGVPYWLCKNSWGTYILFIV